MDIAFKIQDNGESDISINKGAPEMDNGLETAVYISLFTDRRDDNAENPNDKRGWWGDVFDDDPLGSRLWTLARSKMTGELLEKIMTYCKEALEWLIIDDVAKSVTVNATRAGLESVWIEISIEKPDGTAAGYKYEYNWINQGANPVHAR